MKLAIKGGPKALNIIPTETWQPPADEIKAALCDLVDRDMISGDWEKTYFTLEEEFRKYIGAKYCTALNMGTATLWAAYYALGIKPGDEVIVPSYTWVASITPAVYMGATPVFCEIADGTLVADPEDIRKRITSRTKAITIVHLFGNVVNMDEIMKISNEYGIPVIEDCSHCHGAEWKGRKLGTIGHIGCFSMQGNLITGKPVPAGEGGVVVTNDKQLYNKILLYTHMNRPEAPGDDIEDQYRIYGAERLGIKFRAHPLGLAIARVMLKSLDYRNELKTQYRTKITNALKEMKGITTIYEYEGSKSAGFYGGMQMMFESQQFDGLSADNFINALKAEGVNMQYRMYQPMHMMPLFQKGYDLSGVINAGIAAKEYTGYRDSDLPVTEKTFKKLMGMPVYIKEVEGYSDQVIAAFHKVIENYRELL